MRYLCFSCLVWNLLSISSYGYPGRRKILNLVNSNYNTHIIKSVSVSKTFQHQLFQSNRNWLHAQGSMRLHNIAHVLWASTKDVSIWRGRHNTTRSDQISVKPHHFTLVISEIIGNELEKAFWLWSPRKWSS